MKTDKNRKGFTLIEVLVVIFIISIVLGIAVNSVVHIIRNSKEKSIEITKNNVLSVARSYVEEYRNDVYWEENTNTLEQEKQKYSCVTVTQLINKGFLDKKVKEILTSANFIVVWKNANNTVISEEFDENGLCKIVKQPVLSTFCRSDLFYDGSEKVLINTEKEIENIKVSGQTTGIDFGDYLITLTPKLGYNWEDGGTESRTITCTIKAPVYTIKYNGNGNTGGSTASSIHTYGTEKELMANGFTKKGYSFVGWATNKNGNVVYENKVPVINLTITNGDIINLYAKWTVNKIYIYYDVNGGTLGNTTDFTTDSIGKIKYKDTSSCPIHGNGKYCDSNGYRMGTMSATTTTLDLPNVNGTDFAIIKTGYHIENATAWNTVADGSGTSISQLSLTNVDLNELLCDASAGNCTLTLYVNWKAN